ncbi:hypothetical protein RFI_06445 [Reticulomyxa filosa]|uniref:Uncharacterized protein n=1 Tax=Reticulomyxa filosa TaxID=46433 RepID=X6NXX1_RETFI|nr:hypothetical protein RFI_06445 [Reticulomyxa filosa]|eukprot:ETO30674.1 hypothetical protein RFI_06445 [Reticulomyxa filosa]
MRDVCVLLLVKTNRLQSFRDWNVVNDESESVHPNNLFDDHTDDNTQSTNRLDIYQTVLATQNVMNSFVVYLSYPFVKKQFLCSCCGSDGCCGNCLVNLFVKKSTTAPTQSHDRIQHQHLSRSASINSNPMIASHQTDNSKSENVTD